MFLSKNFATSVVFSVLVGYASTHPENVSTKNNKNVKFPMVLGICVKSTYQSSNGYTSLYCTLSCQGAFCLRIVFGPYLTGLDNLNGHL